MLYTAMKILDMKYPDEWQEEAEKLKSRGEEGWMGGLGVIAYINNGYYGAFTVKQYKRIIELTLKGKIKRALENGLTIEEALNKLDSS
jgi:hypothetical protein